MYRLRREAALKMQAHAVECSPNECCGLLGGQKEILLDYYPLTNRAETPERHFFAAPEEIFEAMRRMRKRGQQHLGIYHSHPHSQAYPSTTDIDMAFYPQAVNFIMSLHTRELRAFYIEGGCVIPVQYSIID